MIIHFAERIPDFQSGNSQNYPYLLQKASNWPKNSRNGVSGIMSLRECFAFAIDGDNQAKQIVYPTQDDDGDLIIIVILLIATFVEMQGRISDQS